MQPEIHEPEPAQRRRLIKWLVVVAICGGLLLLIADLVAERVAVWAAEDPGRSAARAGLVFATIGLATALPVLGVVIYLFKLARAVAAARRYPPPDWPVAFRTHVLHGERALIRARLMRFLAWSLVIVMLAEIYLLFALWRSLETAGTVVAAIV